MSKEVNPVTNYESQTLIAKTHGHFQSSSPIFVLCDKCYWCSTYLDKTRLLSIDNNKCPNCYTINTLSSFPVMSNESFTFDYDEKRGLELKFMNRK
jgi:phage FluMu protein Com